MAEHPKADPWGMTGNFRSMSLLSTGMVSKSSVMPNTKASWRSRMVCRSSFIGTKTPSITRMRTICRVVRRAMKPLLDCPKKFISVEQSDLATDARGFSELALKRPAKEWMSDDSAEIYCRCRTLPLVIWAAQDSSDELTNHVIILAQLTDNTRLAIGEASGDQRQDSVPA